MQLLYRQEIRNNIVTIYLESTNFTPREIEALKRFGEPTISIDKLYPIESDTPLFPVKIDRKIRSSFRVKVRFDGTEDLDAAMEASESFFNDIKNILETELTNLVDKLNDNIFLELGSGVEVIRSGIECYRPNKPKGCNRLLHPYYPYQQLPQNIVLPYDSPSQHIINPADHISHTGNNSIDSINTYVHCNCKCNKAHESNSDSESDT